jgi:hypothetical protein
MLTLVCATRAERRRNRSELVMHNKPWPADVWPGCLVTFVYEILFGPA